jgi:DNA-binding response OmpR family regulator
MDRLLYVSARNICRRAGSVSVNTASPAAIGSIQGNVLIISDIKESASAHAEAVCKAGLAVRLISIGEDVAGIFAEEVPDLIIIEDFNDQTEELEICRQLRSLTVVPVLYLTNKSSHAFQCEVYAVGADECIVCPLIPELFQSKVKAWLRRTMAMPMAGLDEICLGDFHLLAAQKRLVVPGGQVVRLTALETRLLFLLMSHPGCAFDSEEIVEKVWGYYGDGDSRLLKNHIYRLRRKIEPDPASPCHLASEGYSGYKFQFTKS